MKNLYEKENFKFLNVNNLFLLTFIFYYYLPPEIGIFIYGILFYLIFTKFNIILKKSDFLLFTLIVGLSAYYISSKSGQIIEIVNMIRFFIGIPIFYIFFYYRKSFDATNLLYISIISIFIEFILLNTIVTPYDMPNWPIEEIDGNSHFKSTVALTAAEGGGLGQTRIGTEIPLGFGGMRSVTSCLLVIMLFISRKTYFNELLVLATVIFLGTGTGIVAFLAYLILNKKYIYLYTIIALVPFVFMFLDYSVFDKVSYEYLVTLLNEKQMAIDGSYEDKNMLQYYLGVGILDGSSDFAWLLMARSIGIIFLFAFIAWIFTKIKISNIGILMLLLFTALHYPTLFSVQGHLLVGYILSRRNIKNYFL